MISAAISGWKVQPFTESCEMRPPASPKQSETFIHAGELHFGGNRRLRTLLGSCIAVTLWHPRRRIGGMCHFMLPGSHRNGHFDGRYAEDALQWLAGQVRARDTEPAEYEAKAFGGGRMYQPGRPSSVDIAGHNVASARRLIAAHNFRLKGEHLAGHGHRSIVFDIDSGAVWVKHVAPLDQPKTTKPIILHREE